MVNLLFFGSSLKSFNIIVGSDGSLILNHFCSLNFLPDGVSGRTHGDEGEDGHRRAVPADPLQ